MTDVLAAGLPSSEALLEALALPVMVVDAQGIAVHANLAMHQALGLGPGMLAHPEPAHDLLRRLARRGLLGPLRDGADADDLARRAFEQRAETPLKRARMADGSTLLWVAAAAPPPDRIDDATLASIVDHIPHGIAVYGPDRRLCLVNSAYNEVMQGAPIQIGESVDEIIGRRARSGEYGPGPIDEVTDRQRAYDNRRSQFRRRRRPDGRTIDVRTAPLPNGGHLSVVTDVTKLVTAEEELARRAEWMDVMLANIRHGIVLWDRERRVVAANATAERLLQAPPGLFVAGRPLEATVVSARERGNLGEGEAAEARARHLLTQDRTQSHLDQRLTRDGRVLEVRSDPTPQGGFVTTYTDVSEIREAEEALRLSKQAAEAANTAKSTFLAAMSTELRNPLIDILNATTSLKREAADRLGRPGARFSPAASLGSDMDSATALATQLDLQCSTIAEGARTLLGLIDTILDVARLESGRFDLADEHVDVGQLMRACLRLSDAAAAAAEVALVVDRSATMPPIRADERRLRQALGHVVSHAVRSAGPGGSVTLSARHDWSRGELRLAVQYTGTPLSEAEGARLFEPFVGSAARPVGDGLGLYVSRILLRAHGGEIVLRSSAAEGTTITLHIPADHVALEAEA